MIELNVVVFLDIVHELSYLTFEAVHVLSQLILLAEILMPHLIQGAIIDFEQVLNALLMMIQLLHDLLLFGDIRMLKLDDILLDLLANVS